MKNETLEQAKINNVTFHRIRKERKSYQRLDEAQVFGKSAKVWREEGQSRGEEEES